MKRIKMSELNKVNFFLLFFAMFFMVGCSAPKKVAYFQDITNDTLVLPSTGEIKIEPNDKLSIVIKSMDPNITSLFNLPVVSDRLGESINLNTGIGTIKSGGPTQSGLSRYTVTPEGTIDFPVLGQIKVAGMTRSELAGFIKGELMGRDLAKDPVVTVEFVNMGVSLMGEINKPGMYDINQDQINILEAIAMAGDLTLLGQRDNIAVIREIDGQLKTYRVDLTNFQELTKSPVYYLKQGDIIYVEPNDVRKRQTTTNGNNVLSTSFWISVASLLTSVVTTIGVFVVK